MACFVLLNGARADEVLELDPGATLTLGSGPQSHILLPGGDAAELHAQVYPADGHYWFQDLGHGFTAVNARELSRAVHQLVEHDVLLLGATFIRFLLERPTAAAGSDTELEALRQHVATLQDEATSAARRVAMLESTKKEATRRLDSVRSKESAARRDVKRLTRENEALTSEAERLRSELQASAEEAESRAAALRAELDGTRSELANQEQLAGHVAELEPELARLRDASADNERLAGQVAELEAELTHLREVSTDRERLDGQVTELQAELERLRDELADKAPLDGQVTELQAELERLRDELADQARLGDQLAALQAELERLRVAEADNERLSVELTDLRAHLERVQGELDEARANDREQELSSVKGLLEDLRDSLEALGVARPASELPRSRGDDAGAILDGVDLAPNVKDALEVSLTRHVERESLRRLALSVPAFAPLAEAREMEDELRTLRTRATHLASAIDLAGPH